MTAAMVGLIAALALIPAWIAARKTPETRATTFVGFYIIGLLIWILAVPAAIWLVKDKRRRCPMCAERIREEAVKCPHCHVTIGSAALESEDDRPKLLDGAALRDKLS